jgi:Tol biopolymer transport system component
VVRLPVVSLCVGVLFAASISSIAADRILEDRLGPTQATLYIANADGTGEHALSQPGSFDYDPSWSPKGDWIVFASERTGPAELFRIHPDGSGLEQLTDEPAYNDQAAFSADGKGIVFVSTRAGGHANLWILDIATRKARPLTSADGGDFRPSWSPDGKWIAFSSDRGSDLPPAKGRWERLQLADVYLNHPDGSGLRRLSEHGGFCGSPKWTPDSKSVVAYCMPAQDTWTYRFGDVDGSDKLMKMDIATGTATEAEAGPGVKLLPAVLPSGEIAYLRRDKIVRGVFYGKGTPGPTGNDLRTPSWSPDGERLVYSRFVYKRPSMLMKEWSRNKDFELLSTAWLPDYDRSGEHLAVTKIVAEDRPGVYSTSLFVGDDGKEPQSILTRKGLMLAPSWSPDGKQIVVGVGDFTSFLDSDVGDKKPVDPVNGGAQVAMVNADGSDFHLITSGPNNNAFAAFAPDGKHLVYRMQGPDGAGLRIMNLEDHSVKTLTDDYDNFPVWSPRGDLIAFMRRIDGFFQICTIHPDGSGFRQLTNVKGNEAHMAWSPDGERILFTSSRMGFKDEVFYTNNPQPYGEIFVMRSDGTEVGQITDDQWEEGTPAWQPKLLPPAVVSAASK